MKTRNPEPVTAQTLLSLLAYRHASDVFVPECKDGPTWGSTHFRLDAWAMSRSWSHPLVSGYEIKVSRSDFLKDDKWPAYLPCCNAFYFVCPQGLIEPSELSADCGLLYATRNGGRLFMKKKAPVRSVEIPESVWRYILMSRAIIKRNRWDDGRDNARYWKDWLEQKEEDRRLGAAVSKGLQKLVEKRITAVEIENRELQARIKEFEKIRQTLERLGFGKDQHVYEWQVRQQLERAREVVPRDFQATLDGLIRSATAMRDEVRHLIGGQRESAQAGGGVAGCSGKP